jgi:predicted amidohydrolase
MTGRFTAACVQMTSGREPEANIRVAQALVRQAREAGAELIMTPETTDLIEPRGKLAFEKARPEAEHGGLAAFRDLAADLGVWLLAGSFVVRLAADRLANRSVLIGPGGDIAARYDKIHMFDVDIPDGQSYRESRAYQPGSQAVVADLPWGRLGLTVCYDLRFPQLYRILAKGGADFISVPAAFTKFTGRAHWHVLLRARAVETGCFVFAPAQCGIHAEGRKTYGHSLIVAPWGEVLADGGEAPSVITAEIDVAEVVKARAMVPSLSHDQPFGEPAPRPALREAGE